MSHKVVTRIAPSPTGSFHIGTARTALFNYLFAKKNKGDFVIRIEDTDKERSKKEYEEEILESLKWLGLKHDRLERQSDLVENHKKYIQQLIDSENVYKSTEKSKTDGNGEVEVIRFRNPNKEVVFEDLIRGEVKFDTTELGDFIIARSINDPLFHLVVVADDHDMGITHIIRGEDHISNTPRQILIQEALGFTRPKYAHIPLILASDRVKLSKRTGTAKSVFWYKNEGYMSEAVVNYLALLGWNPGGEKEVFSMEELIELFDIEKVQKGGAIFDEEKLRFFNGEHLKKKDHKEILEMLKGLVSDDLINIFKTHELAFNDLLDRIEVITDVDKMSDEGEFDFYLSQPNYKAEDLLWKETPKKETVKHLNKVKELISLVTDFSAENIKKSVWDYASEEGRGKVLWPLRYSLSGVDKSPDPFLIASVIGKEETLNRINHAVEVLK